MTTVGGGWEWGEGYSQGAGGVTPVGGSGWNSTVKELVTAVGGGWE